MRRFLLFFLIFLWGTDAEAALSPSVHTVDFYPAGARFVFQVKGTGNFEFVLPGAFDPNSVRPLAQEGISSLKVEPLPRKEWIPQALEPLRSKIDERELELKNLESRKNVLLRTLNMIDAPLPKDFSGKDLILYIEDARALRFQIGKELIDLDDSIGKTSEELETMRAEYSRKAPSDAASMVLVSGTAATSDALLFEAFTYAAGWNVRYDMDLNSTSGVVDAKMHARAWQKTGIDAAGEFSFHTRQPSFAVYPPDVHPLVVDFASPNARRNIAYAPMADMAAEEKVAVRQAPALNMMAGGALPPAMPSMTPTLANVSVKGSGSLRGDGTPEDIGLGTFSLQSTPVLVSIPEQNREAWIVASMDAIAEPLLAGSVELAVDGAMTGRSQIPEYGMGQTYIPFGMASRLSARKERLIGKTASSWLGNGIQEDGYTLSITSGLEVEREVTVKDRLPFPANEKIVLEVKRIEPEPVERDKHNTLTWKFSLKPGETRNIVVEYTLKYPGDTVLEYRDAVLDYSGKASKYR